MPANVRKIYSAANAVVAYVKDQHINATTTLLPRGLHVVTADIQLLCCLSRQDATVDDTRKHELTANDVFFNPFFTKKNTTNAHL